MKPAPSSTPAPLAAGRLAADVSIPSASDALSVSRFYPRYLDFYELTKPGMNMLVLATAAAGWFIAAPGPIDWSVFIPAMSGIATTAGAASALNQYAERSLDARMRRTANRPLPSGRVGPRSALLFGIALGVLGVGVLLGTNALTALLGLTTLLLYVFVYTPLKTVTPACTLIGAVPGAIPPVMGFTAATGVISWEAAAVFAILFFWQIPHFLAIAVLYRDDYAAAGFRMLPVVDADLRLTSRRVIVFALLTLAASAAPAAIGMAGSTYVIASAVLGGVFLWMAVRLAVEKSKSAARLLFIASIVYLPLLLAALILDRA